MTPAPSLEPGPLPTGGSRGGAAPGRNSGVGLSRPGVLVGLVLVAAVAAVYAPTLRYDFVNLDDPGYVTENPHVTTGLSAENAAWAATHIHGSYWHPLTGLSHMLDCEWYGLAAGGHHATSIALHAAAAVALFLALRRLTGDLWPSAFVAGAFALHPLRVESVAWVAERKDVLSGLFFALTLLAYGHYVRTPSVRRYLLVAAALACGLMSKPMLVTTPCVLLLLDYWPLRRLGAPGAPPVWRVLAEKLPLLALAAGSALATVLAQSEVGAVVKLDNIPLYARVNNALVSYVAYLGQTVYPVDLAAFYPHPGVELTTGRALGAAAALVALTAGAVALRRRCPAVLVGWLWYGGMLVPVIGLVQVGMQARADRFTYLPQIGLWVALAWGVPWARVGSRRGVAAGAVAVLVTWALLSARQVEHWRDSETVFTHCLSCTGPNFLAYRNLGSYLESQGRSAEAAETYRRLLESFPFEKDQAHYDLAVALSHSGRDAEAAVHFRRAYELNPARTEALTYLVLAHLNEGTRQAQQERFRDAMSHFNAALEVDPENAAARQNKAILLLNLGLKVARSGRPRDALPAFREAIRTDPTLGPARTEFGVVLMEVGEFGEAADAFREALRIDPNDRRAKALLDEALRQPRR